MFCLIYKMIPIIVGFISLFNSAFSAARHLRNTAQEFTGLPLDIVVQAVTSLFAIICGVLNVAGNRREIQAADELNRTAECDTQCNLPSYYSVNHRDNATSTEAELEKIVLSPAQGEEIIRLKEKNNVLVQELQLSKNENMQQKQEIAELRDKVIRLQSDGAADGRKLDRALQSTSAQLSVAIELAKTYMRNREGPDVVSPRSCNISDSAEKVHREAPVMTGGQSLQPVVPLSRATLNFNTPNVSIPLMRDISNNVDTDPDAASNDSGENITFHSSTEEAADESATDDENFDSSSPNGCEPRHTVITVQWTPDYPAPPSRALSDGLLRSLSANNPKANLQSNPDAAK